MNGLEAKDRSSVIQLAMFLVGYGAVLLLLLDHIPLWLDEIANLNVLVQPDLRSLIESLKSMSGGTPLPYVASSWMVQLLGPTVFASRLLSAISSIAACVAVFFLSRRFSIRQPLIAVALFALCPMQFRYAMEARPYEMALAFSVWSTVVLVSLIHRTDDSPSRSRINALTYCAFVMLSGSTMVYALFVPAAHAFWLIATERGRQIRRSIFWVCCGAITLAVAAQVPWYLLFREAWAANSQHQHVTTVTFAALNVMAHEMTGAGYIGSALLAIGVVLGCLRMNDTLRLRSFFVHCALIPALAVPLADIVFYYFFAVRQMIAILPPLMILFAAGIEYKRFAGRILLAATTVTFLYADVNWVTRPHENWNAAGLAAEQWLEDPTACVIFLPPQDGSVYQHPNLTQRRCSENPAGPVVLAISPYEADESYGTTTRRLSETGYVKQSERTFIGPRVEIYVRR